MYGEKSNLSCGLKLKPITTYHLWLIYCKNIVDLTLLKYKKFKPKTKVN